MLIGRDPEQRLIESLLQGARQGVSAALVIRGVAGIGKTALVESTLAGAGMRTLRCSGVQSEHDLPFAALQQILRPVQDLNERLPEAQAAALRGALGMSSERVEDRLLLGLATLNLLAEATEDGPLVCMVDDLQWVDDASSQALLFAARRLGSEGVVMLFSVRDEPADWFDVPGIQQVTLAPLSDLEARELLASNRAPLTAAEVDRLLGEAHGNPLALLELPAPTSVGGPEPMGIEAAFRARVTGLPAETRHLLLLAAAAEGDDVSMWTQLATVAGAFAGARQAAVDAGLIGDVDAVVFRHPLVRSAVYNSASPAERAAAHRLLASTSTDPLSRASHLAAASVAPDEALADELDAAATVASDKAAFAAAASAYARAAALSVDDAGRVRRLVKAAQAYLDAGRSDLATALAQDALPRVSTIPDQAALATVRGTLEVQLGSPAAAYQVLVTAAEAVREDPARALELLAQAIAAAFVGGWPERAFADARAFLESLPPAGAPSENFLRVFLSAVAPAHADDRARVREGLAQAARSGAGTDFRFVAWTALASAYLGDLRAAREQCVGLVASTRAAASFSTLPLALLALGRMSAVMGDFDQSEECVREGLELTAQLAQHNFNNSFSAIHVRVLAARGEVDQCRDLGETVLRRALAHGVAVAASDVRLGLAELELSLGNGAAARELFDDVAHPLMKLVATPSLVETLLLCGEPGQARVAVEQLARYLELGEDPYFRGPLARCWALLAESPDHAEALFLEALAHHDGAAQTFERARTELAYGEFLRRAQRRTAARGPLRAALATFEGLRVPLWAGRARAELEASGITARKRDPSTRDDLTPQELRIAKLVATGASNRDVASQLFLSPKTVEYHLRKVFTKLGVSSRVELARAPL